MVEISNEILLITGLVMMAITLLGFLFWVVRKIMKKSTFQQRTDEEKYSQQVKVKTKGRSKKELPSLDEPSKEKEMPDYTKNKGFNVVKDKRSKLSVSYWKDWWQDRRNPHKIVLINMELMNGFHLSFQVTENEEGFNYRNKKYLFDNESKYYNLDVKLWCYDFHEMFSIPVKRTIPVLAIQNSIQSSKITEIEHATNPATLERFAVSKIAEGIMRGAQMDDFFKFIRMMLIAIGVGVYLHLILFIIKSGMLQQVTSGII